jgi:NADPH:quinone reductase
MVSMVRAYGLSDETASAAFLEVPVPEPGPGEVRVRVLASSVNGYDAFVASGMARGMMEHRYPTIIGKDFAGTVDAVGEGVDGFGVADEVVGITPPTPYVASEGAYAEYISVPLSPFLQPKPANLDMLSSASVGLAALTASVCVHEIGVSEGATVLIVGATVGVGSYAVQLAAARGATVIATALAKDDSWIRDLGATAAVDYSNDVVGPVRDAHPDGVDGLIVATSVTDSVHWPTSCVTAARSQPQWGGRRRATRRARREGRECVRPGRPGTFRGGPSVGVGGHT